MIMMASGRFLADNLIEKLVEKIAALQVSGVLIWIVFGGTFPIYDSTTIAL
jgi:acetylglutamate kinase